MLFMRFEIIIRIYWYGVLKTDEVVKLCESIFLPTHPEAQKKVIAALGMFMKTIKKTKKVFFFHGTVCNYKTSLRRSYRIIYSPTDMQFLATYRQHHMS